MPGDSAGLGDGDRIGVAILDGTTVAVCAVGVEENFDDKLDNHPLRPGEDDLGGV